MSREDIIDMSSNNGRAVAESDTCGCFVCGGVYPSMDVEDFDGNTAICPVCSKPGVLPSSTGLPVGDEKFLEKIKQELF